MFFLPITDLDPYSNSNQITTLVFFGGIGTAPPHVNTHILTEGGDNLALENGDLLITET